MPSTRILFALAALYGACGTMLLAAGSHSTGGLATTAGQMLLWHAPAILSASLARDTDYLHRAMASASILLLILGAALFALDLVVRAFLGWPRLFPMAAPVGGSLLILGWFVLALAAIGGGRRAQ